MELLGTLHIYGGTAIFLLKLLVASIFITSGWKHVTNLKERSKSIGLPPSITLLVGLVEILAPIALIVSLYTELATLGLIVVMLGAIYKKLFIWKTGFWGSNGIGWHYDLLLLLVNLVFLTYQTPFIDYIRML